MTQVYVTVTLKSSIQVVSDPEFATSLVAVTECGLFKQTMGVFCKSYVLTINDSLPILSDTV